MIQEYSLRKSIIEYLQKRVKDPEDQIKKLRDELKNIETKQLNLIKLLPTKSNTFKNCGEHLHNTMTTVNALLNWDQI